MGTKLKDLVQPQEVNLQDLSGRNLVVDAFNTLYQFLASIRQRDGTLLMDSQGRPTSHLSGLFFRSTKLLSHGLKLAFVFDGPSPKLKQQERERRAKLKEHAQVEYEAARGRNDIDGMRKYAARTTRLSPEMIAEAKALALALGMPVVQAPCEGEAQAAMLVKEGKAYAEISQDFDCLLFGVPQLIRNLTIAERKKLPGQFKFVDVKPEQISLSETLRQLQISQLQLIALGMLVGTDYNYGGIRGIGPKHGLKLVQKYGEDFDALFRAAAWDEHFEIPWREIMDCIIEMPVERGIELRWGTVDDASVIELLCEAHEFSHERVESTLAKLRESLGKQQQKGLADFL